MADSGGSIVKSILIVSGRGDTARIHGSQHKFQTTNFKVFVQIVSPDVP